MKIFSLLFDLLCFYNPSFANYFSLFFSIFYYKQKQIQKHIWTKALYGQQAYSTKEKSLHCWCCESGSWTSETQRRLFWFLKAKCAGWMEEVSCSAWCLCARRSKFFCWDYLLTLMSVLQRECSISSADRKARQKKTHPGMVRMRTCTRTEKRMRELRENVHG